MNWPIKHFLCTILMLTNAISACDSHFSGLAPRQYVGFVTYMDLKFRNEKLYLQTKSISLMWIENGDIVHTLTEVQWN